MTEPIASAIEVQGLRKVYRSGLFAHKQFQSLAGVDLQVRRGEVFGLLGPNGAGKTTLIKVLLGIIRPSGGTATVLGQRAGSRAARKHIGYLPENLNFAAHQTAQCAMRFYGRLSRMDEAKIRYRSAELIELVGLKGRDRELVTRFSKGMRQRLGLAQAMLHDPDLLILDEPTDGLDPIGRSQIRQLISLLRDQGKTVFLNSHILQEVELICDRVAILVHGSLRGIGRPRELSEAFHGALGETVELELAGSGTTGPGTTGSGTTGSGVALEQVAREVGGRLTALPNQHWHLSVPIQAQNDVDELVDRVRSQGVSLVKLQRNRPSLEQVFLSMVAESHTGSEPSEMRLLELPQPATGSS